MSKDRNKVYVDPSFMPSGYYKKELKLIPFITGVLLLIVYTVFTIVMVSNNKAYFDGLGDNANVFHFISWLLSGMAGFYVIGCFLISIVNVWLFALSGQSESNVVYYLSKVLLLISVLCFILPIVLLILIV